MLRRLDAELVDLALHDANLVSRLREAVASAVAEQDFASTPGSGSGTVPVGAGAAVVLSVLDAIASEFHVPDETAAAVQELIDLQAQLRDLRRDPSNVENLSTGALLRRAIRGRKG